MGLIQPDLSGIVDGQVGDAVDWTNPINTITNEINGRLDTTNFTAAGTNLGTVAQAVSFSTWSPTFGGFSVNPSGTGYYLQIGKLVWAYWVSSGAGTSNATSFTITLPVAAKRSQNFPINYRNNGTNSTTSGTIVTTANSTTANLYTDWNGGTWASSNGKYAEFSICYEAQ